MTSVDFKIVQNSCGFCQCVLNTRVLMSHQDCGIGVGLGWKQSHRAFYIVCNLLFDMLIHVCKVLWSSIYLLQPPLPSLSPLSVPAEALHLNKYPSWFHALFVGTHGVSLGLLAWERAGGYLLEQLASEECYLSSSGRCQCYRTFESLPR